MAPQKTMPRLWEIGDLACNWLTAIGNKIDRNFIKYETGTHPDYPALTCLTDLLDTGNLDYVARRATIDNLNEFYFPAIAHLNLSGGGNGLFQINTAAELAGYKEQWNGIILYAQPGSEWQVSAHEKALASASRNRNGFIFFALLMAITSLVAGMLTHDIFYALWVLLSASGILASVLLVSQELGIATEFIEKVCGIGGSKTGCAGVLRSKQARGLLGISLAEVSLFYFVSQWIIYLLTPYFPIARVTAGVATTISIGGIFFACWSLYLQKFVIKHWCTLCLTVVAILLAQAILSYTQHPNINLTGIFYFGIVAATILFLLHPVKMMLEKIKTLDGQKKELTRWKKDTYLFISQWEHQDEVDCSAFDGELELANAEAPLQFTIACSPYCGPCAVAHRQINNLIDSYGEHISVKVRFVAEPYDEQNKITEAVNLILNTSNEHCTPHRAIHDWFEAMDKQSFLNKWPLKENKHNYELISLYHEWSGSVGIQYTPTVYLNGKELPKRYQVADLLSMIPELYSTVTEQITK